jgi:CRISPR/Cas system CSM-associated protein Csm2 small subunit
LRDTESALENVLSEFNTDLPKLTTIQLEKFLDIIFNTTDPVKKILNNNSSKPKKKSIKHYELDFHLHYIAICKQINGDCKDMPLTIFYRILDDLDILVGKTAYDPKRHEHGVDKQSLKEVMGKNKVLHSNQ